MGAVEKMLQGMEQWSSNLSVHEPTWGSLLNHKLLGHTLRVPHPAGLEWGLGNLHS